MIDLIDARDRSLDGSGIKHGTVHMFDVGVGRGRRTNIENAYPLPTGAERFYEMMSDETTATGNQYESHAEGLLFRF